MARTLPSCDQFGEGFELLADRRAYPILRWIELPLAEHRLVAFRPVQLVEVDVIGLQALQGAFDGGADVGAVECRRPAANPVEIARGSGDLGRDDDLLALLALQPAPDDALRSAESPGARRHGVHLGGVDEIDAAGQRESELAVGILFAGLFAEGHRAEADVGNEQIAAAEGAWVERVGHGFLRNLAVFQGQPQSTP